MSTPQICPMTQGFREALREIGDRLDRAQFGWTFTTGRQTPSRDTNAEDRRKLGGQMFAQRPVDKRNRVRARPVHDCGPQSKEITCDAWSVPLSRRGDTCLRAWTEDSSRKSRHHGRCATSSSKAHSPYWSSAANGLTALLDQRVPLESCPRTYRLASASNHSSNAFNCGELCLHSG